MKGYVTKTSEYIFVIIYSGLLYGLFYHPILMFISTGILMFLQPIHYFNPADGKDNRNESDNKEIKGDE